MRSFVRQKAVYQSDKYIDVAYFNYTDEQAKAVSEPYSRRKVRSEPSRPAQTALNEKNAKIYFGQLINCNFGEGDIHITATYALENTPETLEQAQKEIHNFIKRINYRRIKAGLKKAKWIMVTETVDEDGADKRIHHHIIIEKGLTRDEIEDCWQVGRGKNKKRIGYINTDRLQISEDGLCAISKYLCKQRHKKMSKRWTASTGLEKPYVERQDSVISRSKLHDIASSRVSPTEILKRFAGYEIVRDSFNVNYNEISGYYVSVKLRRIEYKNSKKISKNKKQ